MCPKWPPPFDVSRWISEEWEHCTKTCGSLGFQIRTVRCVQFLHDGTNRSVHSKYCSGEKPESRRPCNRVACPAHWRTGAWSEVRSPHDLFDRQKLCSNGNFLEVQIRFSSPSGCGCTFSDRSIRLIFFSCFCILLLINARWLPPHCFPLD